MKKLISVFIICCTFLFSIAQNDNLNNDAATVNKEFHDIVKSMPTPVKELEDLHQDKVKFNEHLLSSPLNLKKHETDAAVAINCGIYLVDFAYLAVYHQQDKMIEYRQLAHELAFKLDAAEPFHNFLSVNLEEKVKDHEELKKHVQFALTQTEEYLINNNKLTTASQILLGSWIETQYIMLQSFMWDKKQSDEVKKDIMSQQVHLENLIKLVHEFKDEAGLENEHEKLEILLGSFKKIHSVYEVDEKIVMELKDEITRLRMDILSME